MPDRSLDGPTRPRRAASLLATALLGLGACNDGTGSGDTTATDPTDGQAPPPSYHADIRPLFDQHCVSCHSEGNIGPFDMAFDPEAWADGPPWWVEASTAAIADGSMPPWKASTDEDCRPIEDVRAMPAEEQALVQRWVDLGAPEGDPADYVAPERPPSVFDSMPDHVLRPVEAYTPNGAEPDDYRCFILDYDAAEDAWLKGFEVVPDQLSLVHHAILYRLDADDRDLVEGLDAEDDVPGYECFGSPGTWDADTLAAWAPGQLPESYDEGIARRVPAGSVFVLQMHYNTLNIAVGESVPADRTGVDLWMMPEDETPTKELVSIPVPKSDLDIQAGDPHSVQQMDIDLSSLVGAAEDMVDDTLLDFLLQSVEVIGVMPHMHQLGTSIRMDVVHEDGSESCMFDVPEWDFSWQQTYFFTDEGRWQANLADDLRMTCTYDNSPENQLVVNGEQLEARDVTWGDNTRDEMCLTYLLTTLPPGIW